VLREKKEQVVAELTERLRTSETLIVADYRGLSVASLDGLRAELLEVGATFSVVKNTLTRRAAEAAGMEPLLALLEGPSAVAFVEAEGDPVAVAKALAAAARETRILTIRGGVLQGSPVTAEEVASLATLPPIEILRGQVLGAVTAPLYAIVGLVTAPLRDLVGLIDARIEQLGGETADAAAPEEDAAAEGAAAEGAEAAPEATEPEAEEPRAQTEAETGSADAAEPASAEPEEGD